LDEFHKCRPQLGLEKDPQIIGKAVNLLFVYKSIGLIIMNYESGHWIRMKS
jgi:hypothetical protein